MEKSKLIDPLALKKAVVKQVLSGDCVIIRAQPRGGPPPEKHFIIANVTAPKLGRKAGQSEEVKDEPMAWESREFLRKLIIGKEVYFSSDKIVNSDRIYGNIYLDKDGNSNVSHILVSEGMVSVRRENTKSSETAILIELEEAAKANLKGKWNPNAKVK
uniref:CSON001629 protein n=1 Tax=Culicoides sonorensis TaxID=179676 RepID=A0A336MH54_CULSO